jgi:hypothetical protein
MAAGTLPKPGTHAGPCLGVCEHTDCAATRRDAESPCSICGKPIGYDRRFYHDESGLVHAVCVEEEFERSRAR